MLTHIETRHASESFVVRERRKRGYRSYLGVKKMLDVATFVENCPTTLVDGGPLPELEFGFRAT